MKKIYGLAFASSLFLLGSCASDAPLSEGENGGDPTEGKIGYLTIALNTGETRATEASTADENKIKNICFIFEDKNGGYFKRYTTGTTGESGDRIQKITRVGDESGHAGDVCYLITLDRGAKNVACIINHSDPSSLDEKVDEKYITKYADSNNYFVMSSATYYDDDNHKSFWTPISDSNLFADEEEAKQANLTQAVMINVERACAKMKIINNLTLTEGELDTEVGDKFDATISFKPEFAFINNVRNQGYVIKDVPLYNDLLEGFKAWAVNDGKTTPTVGGVKGALVTNSYSDVTTTAADPLFKFPTSQGEANAQVSYRFDARSGSALEFPQLVVLGKYTCTRKSDNKQIKAGEKDDTFWVVAVESGFKVVGTEEEAIALMEGVFNDEDSNKNDKLVPEGVSDSTSPTIDGWKNWTGWYKLSKTTNAYRAMKYTGGYGYYTKDIIRHQIGSTSLSAIVRNHVYKLSVNGIKGLGVGIPETTAPIIPLDPPSTDITYYLHMSVDILDWQVVTQGFTWGM